MNDATETSPDAQATSSPPEVTPESIVEALLFSTDRPLSAVKIAKMLGIGDGGDVRGYVETLNAHYKQRGAAFRIDSVAKGYQMLTCSNYDPWLSKLHETRSDSRVSPAALETLAIIAYKQPVLRASIETIRGVAAGDMLVRLREMHLARIVGRAEEIGRPLLYGTTTKFLDVFGLKSLKDLPKLDPDRPEQVPKLKVVDQNAMDEPVPNDEEAEHDGVEEQEPGQAEARHEDGQEQET